MDNVLHINDLFYTFQGEGKYSGSRALFVRMPFCNLKCSWCDTQFNTFTKWTDNEFLGFANQEKCKFAVITGGEPTMNKQTPWVISLLKSLGYFIAVETNGNFPIPEGIDFVTCSPKRDATPPYFVSPKALGKVSEFKYVVDDGFDFSILDRHSVNDGRRYSLSPEWGAKHNNLNIIFDYIKDHPGWKLSLQTHKWLGIP